MPKKKYDKRPWGEFFQFTENEVSTVKLLNVEPNSALSLQIHEHRDELWRVLSGQGIIRIGDESFHAKENDEFFIKRGQVHRITTNHVRLKILEIAFGKFDEDDIQRIEDDYDRV